LTGPNPTDRGKLGSKIHVVCDRNGLPLSAGISGANLHDSQALVPLMRGIPPIRSRHGPRHADKGYDFGNLRHWLRRWWNGRCPGLNGCRRLHRRYERKAEHFLAFVGRHRQRPPLLPAALPTEATAYWFADGQSGRIGSSHAKR
jgi:transposase